MVDTPPRRNLPSEAERWGRWIEDRVKELERASGGSKADLKRLAKLQSIHAGEIQKIRDDQNDSNDSNDEWRNEYEDWWNDYYAPDPTTPPSTPTFSSRLGVALVEWDGLMANGDAPGSNFKSVTAEYALTEPPGQDPAAGEPGYEPIADPTVWITAGIPLYVAGNAVITGLDVGTEVWVRLRAQNNAGVDSGASEWVHGTIDGINTDDLEKDIQDELKKHDDYVDGIIDVTPNPAPAAPTLSSRLGVIVAEWDGLLGGETPPLNFKSVIAEHREVGTTPWIRKATPIIAAGAAVITGEPIGTAYEVRLIAINTQGFESDPSPSANITVDGIEIEPFDPSELEQDILDAQRDIADAALKLDQAQQDIADAGSRLDDAFGAIDDVSQDAADAIAASDAAAQAAASAQSAADRALARAVNVLPDPSFEQEPSPYSLTGRYSIAKGGTFHTGAWSLRSDAAEGTQQLAIGEISVVPGRTYRYSAWVRTTGTYNGTDGNGKLRVGSSEGLFAGAAFPNTGGTAWEQVVLNLHVPLDATYSQLTVQVVSDHTQGTLWIDDMFLGDITEAWEAISAAEAAQDAADQAAAIAMAKAETDYSTATPKTTDVRPRGSVWFQVNAAGEVLTQWQNTSTGTTGGTWTKRPVTSEAIANLDVGKLRALSATIDSAVIEKLFADVVVAKSKVTSEAFIGNNAIIGNISTSKLIVGDFTNLVADPNFTDIGTSTGNSWRQTGSGTWTAKFLTAPGHQGVTLRGPYTANTALISNRFSVKPGDQLYGRATIMNRTEGTIHLRVYFFDESGAAASGADFRGIGSAPPTTSGAHPLIEGDIVVPAGATQGEVRLFAIGPTSGDAAIGGIQLLRKATGELIVDGAIKAAHVDAQDLRANTALMNQLRAGVIEAGKIEANEINVGDLRAEILSANAIKSNMIDTGAITADKIEARSINASKLVLSDSTNLIADPTFTDIGSSTAFSWRKTGSANWGPLNLSTGEAGVNSSGPWNGANSSLLSSRFAVKQDDKLYARARGLNNLSGSTLFRLYFFDGAGAATTPAFVQVGLFTGGWQTVSSEVIVPPGAVEADLRFMCIAPTAAGSQYFRVGGVQVLRKSGAELIVSGSISADHIAAHSITSEEIDAASIRAAVIEAGKIKANDIDAGSIRGAILTADSVVAGTIKSGSIEARHITTDKINANDLIVNNSITAAHILANDITTNKLIGNTITGRTIQTAASGDRTVMDLNGLRVIRGGVEQVRVGHGIATGLSVRNPYTNALEPLSNTVFGSQSYVSTASVQPPAMTSSQRESEYSRVEPAEFRFTPSSNRFIAFCSAQAGSFSSLGTWTTVEFRLIRASDGAVAGVIGALIPSLNNLAGSDTAFFIGECTPGTQYAIRISIKSERGSVDPTLPLRGPNITRRTVSVMNA